MTGSRGSAPYVHPLGAIAAQMVLSFQADYSDWNREILEFEPDLRLTDETCRPIGPRLWALMGDSVIA